MGGLGKVHLQSTMYERPGPTHTHTNGWGFALRGLPIRFLGGDPGGKPLPGTIDLATL